MSFSTVNAAEWLADPSAFDTVIDVRSPSEFAEDHLPGSVNWPVLDDLERARVGTIYKQVSTFEARKVGGALVSRRIADILDQWVADKPKDWRPLVVCWRGGQRSGSLSLVLAQVGFRTRQLAGGYKGFRACVRDELTTLPGQFTWQVISGRTGSGKTRLLHALRDAGAQTLDLEALAAHRGSVLGGLPNQPQPSQKRFESLVWGALKQLDPTRPVFVESESRKIGQRQVPEALLQSMRNPATLIEVSMPLPGRVELLLEEYPECTEDVAGFCQRLDALIELRGRELVGEWQGQAQRGDWHPLLHTLLGRHYDPLYDKSTQGNFRATCLRRELELVDGRSASMLAAATALLG
ncbi:tRNA 2-selenouridine(34) synthase MnmH [Ideonella margarita]|uniref:tRNA 2-selenouridine(34) synthase MnmH n=1 Tax=Ideonella margarita TaxID=2984191 RepID=A0ABU9C8Q1_9BURK